MSGRDVTAGSYRPAPVGRVLPSFDRHPVGVLVFDSAQISSLDPVDFDLLAHQCASIAEAMRGWTPEVGQVQVRPLQHLDDEGVYQFAKRDDEATP